MEYQAWKTLRELPKPMERPSVAALGETLFFTDYSTRSIFTYYMTHNKFGRLPFVVLEERTGKGIYVKKTGTILVISEGKATKIKSGKTAGIKDLEGEMGYKFNTPCTLVGDTIYYVSEAIPYKLNLRTCSYERLDQA
jgi:hypothetical protein